MKYEITKRGVYGKDGVALEIGDQIEVATKDDATPGWLVNKAVPVKGGKTAVTNPAKNAQPGLKAEHHGGGKFNITEGETVLLGDLSKADADAFNALSDEDKAAFVADQKKA